MEQKRIIDKICKCLRLSESCNPNEAAAALRQAQGLMKKYGVYSDRFAAMLVDERAVASHSANNPPFWLLALSNLVADAFSCRAYLSRQKGETVAFHFIGMTYAPELCIYIFTLLYRNLRQARSGFIASIEGEIERIEKTRRGDVFAQAWLFRVAKQVQRFAQDFTSEQAIDSYISEKYGEPSEFTRPPAEPDQKDYQDILSGMRAAEAINLLKPVAHTNPRRLSPCV